MDIGQILHDLIFDYTLRTVALGSATLGLISGILGVFAVLRKQSLLGDAISHAALPGVALAFLLTGSKTPLVLVVGAGVAGWVATLAVLGIVRHTRVKEDAALGIVLSVFFGLGLLLLTLIQKLPTASQAGLDKFLFGQAAALMGRDVAVMAILGAVALGAMIVLWKELKLLAFDLEYASSLGLPVRGLEVLLISLIVVAIVIGLQTVGVVLMSAMLIAPAAAARQWTERLDRMVVLSGALGAAAGLAGATASSLVAHLPTGPTIVLTMSAIVVISLLLAPRRGLIAAAQRRSRQRWQFAADALAVHLYHHEGTPNEMTESEVAHLGAHMRWEPGFARRALRYSVAAGLVRQSDGHLRLTAEGRAAAQRAMTR